MSLLLPAWQKLISTGFIVLLAGITVTAFAQTTYYVDAAGSDANNGRSANTPFQSLNRINTLILQPGDSVLFHRGDTFRGSLQIKQSGLVGRPIVIDTYGQGARPVISGAVPVTNWIKTDNNLWEAPCPACNDRVTGLYRNESTLPLGRYPNPDAPNKGYLTVQSHVGKTRLISQEPLTENWVGGELVVRPTQWIIDRAFISAQTSNTLTLTNLSNYELTDHRGYFIQNHRATLDQDGEWYYNPTTKTVQLYDSRNNPNQQKITATVFGRGVDLVNVSFVTLSNLRITQTLTESLHAQNVSNIRLVNDDFTNSGEDGVIILGSGTDILLENSKIASINNNGFWIDTYQNVTLQGNTFRRIGASPGRGKSGDGQYNGLHSLAGQNTLIQNNTIDSIGYNGIDLSYSSNVMFRHNTVSNFCLTKSDGGGVYLWNGTKVPVSNVHIIGNIVYNGTGTTELNDTISAGANGIFLDDCLEYVDVLDNTVFNCNGYGIYLHAVSTVNVTGNTSFNNRFSQFTMYDNGGRCDMRGNVVSQNIFVSKVPAQFVAVYASYTNDLDRYGSLDYNYYVRPFADAFKIRAVYSTIGDDLALSQWQTQFRQDIHSEDSPLTYKGYKISSLGRTMRIDNAFASTSEGWSNWSAYDNGRLVWDNTSRLDGGSLRASFPVSSSSTGSNSYMLITKELGAVTRSQSFVLKFDAVASGNVHVQVFIRKRDSPYQDLDQRFDILVGSVRKSYEFAFTASADEAAALLTYQIRETGQSVFLDNIRLQEAIVTKVQPDEYMRLVYNPTPNDSTVQLTGNYRDVKNRAYSRRVILAPFTSLVLLKDTLPAVDVALALRANKSFYRIGETVTFTLTLTNKPVSGARVVERVQWSCRLPGTMKLVNTSGLIYSDSVLTGTVQRLVTDTTFVFVVKPTTSGLYQVAAQVLASTYADPNSTPNSGTADGEDDTAAASFIIGGTSPKLAQAVPQARQKATQSVVVAPIPTPPIQADLSLRMVLSNRTPALNGLISCTICVYNEGPVAAEAVQVHNQLPDGLRFTSGAGWVANGSLLMNTISSVAVGASVNVVFWAQVIATGRWINQAQISGSSKMDPDSVPGNGFTNGEDDQAQADFRVQ